MPGRLGPYIPAGPVRPGRIRPAPDASGRPSGALYSPGPAHGTTEKRRPRAGLFTRV